MTDISKYFNETVRDYRLIWHTGKHLSMHMGYSNEEAYQHDEAVLRMIQQLATRASITKGDRVLDLGCGVGGSSIWLAANIGCKVTGIDMNPRSLAVATNEAEKRGYHHLVNFTPADYRRLPFASGEVDVAWFLESFCYAPDKYEVLREVYRVLASGGRLVVADGLKVLDGPELDAWLSGWAIPGLPWVTDFQSWLKRLGYRNISIDNVSDHVKDSIHMLHRRSKMLLPVGKVMEKVRLRTPVETGNIVAGVKIYESLIKGQWVYHITTANK